MPNGKRKTWPKRLKLKEPTVVPVEGYNMPNGRAEGYFGGIENINRRLDEWLRIYPDIEKLGITRDDWLVLATESRDPARVKRELDTWISTGYIDRARAQGIWKAVDWMVRQSQAEHIYGEAPEDRERRLAREREAAERARYQAPYRAVPRAVVPTPEPLEYGPALEEMRLGFREEMPRTERWRDWFRSRYPRMIEQFEAKVPEAERKEETWAEHLRKRRPEIREEWWRLTPYERGERPSAFAPRIQTVGF